MITHYLLAFYTVCIGKGEIPELKKKIEDLTLDSLRQRNAYQTEIAKLQKERGKHLATIKEQGRVNQKLHRLAYPERYNLHP